MGIHLTVRTLAPPALSGGSGGSATATLSGRRCYCTGGGGRRAGSDALGDFLIRPEIFFSTVRGPFQRRSGLGRPESLQIGLPIRCLPGPRLRGSLCCRRSCLGGGA